MVSLRYSRSHILIAKSNAYPTSGNRTRLEASEGRLKRCGIFRCVPDHSQQVYRCFSHVFRRNKSFSDAFPALYQNVVIEALSQWLLMPEGWCFLYSKYCGS